MKTNRYHRSALLFTCMMWMMLGTTVQQNAQAQTERSTLRVLAISEAEGTPVVGATVMLTEPDADTLHVGVTDADGFQEFSNIAPQTYRIHISFIGYETIASLLPSNPALPKYSAPNLQGAQPNWVS